MRNLYNFLTHISYFPLWVAAFFNPKLSLFIKGRKGVFKTLKESISKNDKVIWFHCASLGEYEQGVPIMEMVKTQFPEHKVLLTFFSPSGYEVKKNKSLAHVVTYLPLDTIGNAKKFIALTHPELVFFIKYDFWPNYLLELKQHNIHTILVSGLFKKKQIFFKAYGKWMRNALQSFNWIFVQNKSSKELLESIGINNVTESGDTRFDRVSAQIEQDNTLDFIEDFKNDQLCIVCGSTWPEDDHILAHYINQSSENIKFLIAPHELKPQKIKKLQEIINSPSVLFSEKEGKNLSAYKVFIMDTIGLLSKAYYYADIAYIGGAMGGTGLHNILEAATFGIPVVIGKEFSKFPEAIKLQKMAGLFSVSNEEELTEIFNELSQHFVFREKTGMICGHFINSNTGATQRVKSYLKNYKEGLA